jgi:hypothetical protein
VTQLGEKKAAMFGMAATWCGGIGAGEEEEAPIEHDARPR